MEMNHLVHQCDSQVSDENLEGSQEHQNRNPKHSSFYQENTILGKFSWIVQPLLFYCKPSNRVSHYFLSVIENIVFQEFSLLTNENEKYFSKDAAFVDSAIESLYRLGFIVQSNLRQSVEYIENVSEEIVPLIPGKISPLAAVDKDNMTVQELSFYLTGHMMLRLTFHAKNYIQDILMESRKIRLDDF